MSELSKITCLSLAKFLFSLDCAILINFDKLSLCANHQFKMVPKAKYDIT